MKSKLTLLALLFMATAMVFTSCKKDEEDDPPAEFVADNASFDNYNAWTYITERQGSSPSLGPAHQGNNADAVRKIWENNTNTRSDNSKYPVGTMFFKETKDSDGNVIELTAMAKRGNNFDPNHNDWEWFMLDPATGDIAQRGLFDGMCLGCHNTVEDKDYVFTKE